MTSSPKKISLNANILGFSLTVTSFPESKNSSLNANILGFSL